VFRENRSTAKLRSTTAATSHGNQVLVLFRSKSTAFEEEKMEKAPVSDPRTVWDPSTVTEELIQALADRGLLRPKTQVD
jgi:hypothetical protein